MALLHTVNKSPFERDSYSSCLRLAKPGSAILLIEDGIYAAIAGTSVEAETRGAMGRFRFYVLEPDLMARGMDRERVIAGIEVIDYDDFVDLAVSHDNVQAWL